MSEQQLSGIFAGSLKFVLPVVAIGIGVGIPVLGGAVAASAVAWKLGKVLDGMKQIQDNIDKLRKSDFQATMILFKDVLITLTNNRYPEVADVKFVYAKAIDAYTKLDFKDLEMKLELVKIQMFCIIYMHSYDKEKHTMLTYDRLDLEVRNMIKEKFNVRLKDLEHLLQLNRVEYLSENSWTRGGDLKNEGILRYVLYFCNIY